jgi:hypothetical protein
MSDILASKFQPGKVASTGGREQGAQQVKHRGRLALVAHWDHVEDPFVQDLGGYNTQPNVVGFDFSGYWRSLAEGFDDGRQAFTGTCDGGFVDCVLLQRLR